MQQQLLDAEEKDPDVINHLAVSFIRDEPFLERLSRYEQRLELSIHRNLRQLEKLRKQTQRDRANNTEPSHKRCPFLPGDEYETARQLARKATSEDEIEKNKPKSTGCNAGSKRKSKTNEHDDRAPFPVARVTSIRSDGDTLCADVRELESRKVHAEGAENASPLLESRSVIR